MRHILFFFVDGVGLGSPSASNPLSDAETPGLRRLAGGQPWCRPFAAREGDATLVRSLDATLEVEGLPQSGTGQASLLTGVNCAAIVGRHFGPYPHSTTHAALDRHNLFRRIRALGPSALPVTFANAFPPQYFDAARRRATVTTYCCNAAGVTLRDLSALRDRRAVAADLTGASWRERLGLDVPDRSPSEAAEVLLSTARRHSFTLFEYFRTDKVGHGRTDTPPGIVVGDLDRVFEALLDRLDPRTDTLLVTSDHGNLEDMTHTQHTRNPVPLLVHGWAAPYFEQATDLTDVAPAVVAALRSTQPPEAPTP
ncbi:MAG: alkaline phosphatase family protein [Salinibacter sp.]